MTLPNGWRVSHGSPAEASFIYREIFEERCYVQHGIRVHDGSICVDVGANVGAPPFPCVYQNVGPLQQKTKIRRCRATVMSQSQ